MLNIGDYIRIMARPPYSYGKIVHCHLDGSLSIENLNGEQELLRPNRLRSACIISEEEFIRQKALLVVSN
jgi:hypothetical protein